MCDDFPKSCVPLCGGCDDNGNGMAVLVGIGRHETRARTKFAFGGRQICGVPVFLRLGLLE
jgi:hypothetical protein